MILALYKKLLSRPSTTCLYDWHFNFIFSSSLLSERNKHEFPVVFAKTTPTFLHCYFGKHFYSLTFLDISIVLNDIILTFVSGFSFYDYLNWNHFVHRFNEFMWNSIKICNKSCCPFNAKMKYNFRNKIKYVSCFFLEIQIHRFEINFDSSNNISNSSDITD